MVNVGTTSYIYNAVKFIIFHKPPNSFTQYSSFSPRIFFFNKMLGKISKRKPNKKIS